MMTAGRGGGGAEGVGGGRRFGRMSALAGPWAEHATRFPAPASMLVSHGPGDTGRQENESKVEIDLSVCYCRFRCFSHSPLYDDRD